MAYRYFIKLAYEGSEYKGWQIQPNATTIQQFVENGLSAIIGVKQSITGCGRTDSGVSASIFYAHFDSESSFNTEQLSKLCYRLNSFLPPDISVFEIKPVLQGAHARYSALWREYEYTVLRQKDPFLFKQAFLVPGELDVFRMNECAFLLFGQHDFESFSKVKTQVNNFICNVHNAYWDDKGTLLRFTIRADRFLRNMVRAIVGTMIDVGKGKISVDDFQLIIDTRNRSAAGYSVPAKGLTLTGVGYPDEIFADSPHYFLPDGNEKIISHYYTDAEFHNSAGNETNE